MLPTLAEVSYSKGLRKVTCLRFLASKVVYEAEKFRYVDTLAIYDLLLWTQDKASMDRGFKLKFGSSLEVLAQILKNQRVSGDVEPVALAKKVRKRVKSELSSFILPQRNYSQVKSRMSGNFHLRKPVQPGVDNKELPPDRYIGKGYGDKGTARNSAVDGSPTWQQIALDEPYQLKILMEILKNDKTLSNREKLELQREAVELIKRVRENRTGSLDRSKTQTD